MTLAVCVAVHAVLLPCLAVCSIHDMHRTVFIGIGMLGVLLACAQMMPMQAQGGGGGRAGGRAAPAAPPAAGAPDFSQNPDGSLRFPEHFINTMKADLPSLAGFRINDPQVWAHLRAVTQLCQAKEVYQGDRRLHDWGVWGTLLWCLPSDRTCSLHPHSAC